MDLLNIKDPKFLKNLSINELYQLADEIRAFEIESISKTGGHLSSNLGVIELTIAMHYCFNSFEDKIIFDVGHQSYTHKILTGRAKGFSTLRQYNGLSGFQKRSESIHDVWEAGHSSTALSAALGFAVARDLDHKDYYVVPFVGDGSITNGISLEALNQIGELKSKMIIIFNDNQMSITKNTGSLNEAFNKLRLSKPYNTIKLDIKENLNKNENGKIILNSLRTVKDNFKHAVINEGIFDEFNINYLGPVDGHNIKALIKVIELAKKKDGPVIIHCITKKGKGYICENDNSGFWHGVSPFNVSNGKTLKVLPKNYKAYSKAVCDTLVNLAKEDKDIVCITPAMISGSKLEDFFKLYPKQAFDTGIAEEHAMIFAAGLAAAGKKPFISIYSSFLQRAYDQINHDICRMNLNVTIGIDRAGLVGEDGATHHGLFDIGLLRALPNIIIAQGKDIEELENLVFTAMKYQGPFAIRYPKGANTFSEKPYKLIEIGKWNKIYFEYSANCTILAYGENVDLVYNKIIENNLSINLINCIFFKPIDFSLLDELATLNKPIIVFESDMLINGLSDSILEYYNDNNIKIKVIRIGIKDHYIPGGSVKILREVEHIDLNYLFDIASKL